MKKYVLIIGLIVLPLTASCSRLGTPETGNSENICFQLPDIHSHLSVGELWAELMLALENSEQSEIWPNDVERLHSNGEPIVRGTIIKEKIPWRRTIDVQITDLQFEKSFTYSVTGDHPYFEEGGGATVSLHHAPQGGSILRWAGAYQVTGFKTPFVISYFRRFVDDFYQGLRSKLENKKLEHANDRHPRAAIPIKCPEKTASLSYDQVLRLIAGYERTLYWY